MSEGSNRGLFVSWHLCSRSCSHFFRYLFYWFSLAYLSHQLTTDTKRAHGDGNRVEEGGGGVSRSHGLASRGQGSLEGARLACEGYASCGATAQSESHVLTGGTSIHLFFTRSWILDRIGSDRTFLTRFAK